MKRLVVAVIMAVAALIGVPAGAQQRPPGYQNAETAFLNFPLDLRIRLQIVLTAAGYWPAVPNENYSGRLHQAISTFQLEHGLAPDAVVAGETIDRLFDSARPYINSWGFSEIYHPSRPISVWIPIGLGLKTERQNDDLKYSDTLNRISILFATVRNTTISLGYEVNIKFLRERNVKIHYSTKKSNFFVISYSSSNGVDSYIRFQNDGTGITGFFLSWNNSNGNIGGERIAAIMSASLAASATGSPFTTPFTVKDPQGRQTASKPTAQPAITTPQQTDNRQPEPRLASSGTGFFINSAGHMITNAHVVEKCHSYLVTPSGGDAAIAKLVAIDAANDLALLKVDMQPSAIATIRTAIKLGEPVAVFGYPLSDVLSRNGNFTLGNITALAGAGDDSNRVQISAPIQPGNSGGPLLDQQGNLIGIIVSKLRSYNGNVPQNVNFAIKASVALNFLSSNGIGYTEGQTGTPTLDPVALAEKARSISAFILCK